MIVTTCLSASSRRDFLRSGLYALGIGTVLPPLFHGLGLRAAASETEGKKCTMDDRILVVLELTGGNDGLNTVVPFADDAYYQARPKLAIAAHQLLKLDGHFGLNPVCTGLERLFKSGHMAIVHGCGYPQPNLSHFTAMEWWHTAVPHGHDPYGWLGRFADRNWPSTADGLLVNIASRQSRAISSSHHSPIVFNDPKQFGRIGTDNQQAVFDRLDNSTPTLQPSLDFVNQVAHTALRGSHEIQSAWTRYRTNVDYGSDNPLTLDLKKTAALIAADLPTRIFYLNHGGFDTHAAQAATQSIRLLYLSDALRGFMEDLTRLGRAEDVTVLVFTEFGRRVQENASGGTDHGTASPMWVLGRNISGGFYGTPPSLTDLDDGNLKMTIDFRSVYATVLSRWMGMADTSTILKGDFPLIPLWA